jgi:hypothetical protein
MMFLAIFELVDLRIQGENFKIQFDESNMAVLKVIKIILNTWKLVCLLFRSQSIRHQNLQNPKHPISLKTTKSIYSR